MEILLRLADLVDGGEPSSPSQGARLAEVQLQLLSTPATVYSQNPANTAKRLREVSAAIESQIPPHGPAITH